MKTLEQIWTEIESEFDWEKVHKTMKTLNWEWSGGDFKNDPGVPNIRELKQLAKSHIKAVFDTKDGYFTSGGLRAEKDNEGIHLYFVLESAISYSEED